MSAGKRGHPVESLGQVAAALRKALESQPENSQAAVDETTRILREQRSR